MPGRDHDAGPLAGTRRRARNRNDLHELVDALVADHDHAVYLSEILDVLDDEDVFVLHPAEKLGYRVRIGGIADNFQLHTLLAAALIGDPFDGWISSRPVPPRVAAAARDKPAREGLLAESRFDLFQWTGLQADGTLPPGIDGSDHWLWLEDRPADIAQFDGTRVILLGSPAYVRTWNAVRRFDAMPGELLGCGEIAARRGGGLVAADYRKKSRTCRMKYATVFSLFSVYLVVLVVQSAGISWLLLWPALSFGLVAGAYFTGKPRLFGKRPDGRIEWWAWPCPMAFLRLRVGNVARPASVEPGSRMSRLAPGVWIGRRCFPSEIPADVKMVIDLTAEFPAPLAVRLRFGYRCLPTLDALVPDAESFQRLIAEVAACPQAVFVHLAPKVTVVREPLWSH